MKLNKFLLMLFAIVLFSVFVSAQSTTNTGNYNPSFQTSYSSSSAYSVRSGTTPSFQTYYSSSDVSTYWPVLGNRETCEAREDVLLNMAPFGCQPSVVRSDLLAEQNVPVFCQIDAVKINPLIDISQIKKINFAGNYPAEVAGTGFHPARAAIRSQDTLLGSPLINNVGYVIVILKKQPDESKLPDSVNLTLEADIQYVSGNAYGVGRAEFLLEETAASEWDTEKLKQSFWNGRYSLRADYIDENFVEVSIYQGDVRANTVRVERGKTSPKIYVPGMYCRAGLEVVYDQYIAAQDKARIEVSSGNDMDIFDVYDGSRFLDDRCRVEKVRINQDGETGNVTGVCGNQRFILELTAQGLRLNATATLDGIEIDGTVYEVEKITGAYKVKIESSNDTRDGIYYLESNGELREEDTGNEALYNSNGNYGASVNSLEKRQWIYLLYRELMEFKLEDTALNVGVVNASNSINSTKYFNAAIGDYETVADDYGFEFEGHYGREALDRAITLAGIFGNGNIKAGLINKYLELYPNSERAAIYTDELNRIRDLDYSLSTEAIEFDDQVRVVRLVSLDRPSNSSSANFLVEGRQLKLSRDKSEPLTVGNQPAGNVTLIDVKVDEATIGAYCFSSNSSSWTGLQRHTVRLNEASRQPICGLNFVLDETNVEKVAKIRLIPSAEGTRTKTNLTVFVGIEKRAIQLTPSKVEQKIENLNETIEKWTSINEKLGKVVSGMKAACFATAGVLNVKNFLTSASGGAIARQDVMQGENGWTNWCRDAVANKTYISPDQCYLDNADKIDSDVATRTTALNTVNDRVKAIQSKPELITDDSILGKSVDTAGVRKQLAQDIRTRYGGEPITLNGTKWVKADGNSSGIVTVNELLSDENIESGAVTTDDLRTLYLNLELKKQGGVTAGRQGEISALQLEDIAKRTNSNMIVNQNIAKSNARIDEGYPSSAIVGAVDQPTRYMDVGILTEEMKRAHQFELNDPEITHIAVVQANAAVAESRGKNVGSFPTGTYYLALTGDPTAGKYNVKEISSGSGADTKTWTGNEVAEFNQAYGIGGIESIEKISYQNTIVPADRKVRYFETDPYKGMPAIVPFNYREGWYAATRQNLPGTLGAFATGGSGVGTYQSSGRVTSYWLCNVGSNGRVEFNTGYGDDLCQQINVNTGQELNLFPGLDRTKASKLISQGEAAIREAASQYKSGSGYAVRIQGEQYQVGTPEIGTLGTQCQDFMSPKDCLLMFNVCDPVICPSSRCDFGGTYPVANVVQQGIVGSVFLCLPNIREGIVIPVCLTGIHAGIDGLISIMESYRDCLTKNLETGEMVGICDEVYSIYLCEFFWNQVAPVLNVLLPKMVELAYGQGARGGAEYLSVQAAWQNMENSIDYFTQSYAANSMTAFQLRSVEEAGTQFCRSFASVKAPTAFESLIEPDSPTQFHAWFDQEKFTDATVPATSQYKVFFHIFAGNDQGVYYNVYLKNPPQSGYYSVSSTVPVASGYIAKGESADETKDFTAPEGYKELCVRINNEEECGFGQVSTSFAVNYVRDSFVSDELKNTNIQSEVECVSGSNSAGALLNPNIQAGVEETINPEIYNRGVVRICATQNPGMGTDPTRFVDSGHCGDAKIRCWLDQRSVEQALTKSNIGMKNETLSYLSNHSLSILQDRGEIFTESQAEDELRELKGGVTELRNRNGDEAFAQTLLARIDAIEPMMLYNLHRAQLYLIRGEINEIVALKLRSGETEVRNAATSGVVGAGDGTDGSTDTKLPAAEESSGTKEGIVIESTGLYHKFEGGEWKWSTDKITWNSWSSDVQAEDEATELTEEQKEFLNELRNLDLTTGWSFITSQRDNYSLHSSTNEILLGYTRIGEGYYAKVTEIKNDAVINYAGSIRDSKDVVVGSVTIGGEIVITAKDLPDEIKFLNEKFYWRLKEGGLAYQSSTVPNDIPTASDTSVPSEEVDQLSSVPTGAVVFEFQDGKINDNTYYSFYEGVWHWSGQSDENFIEVGVERTGWWAPILNGDEKEIISALIGDDYRQGIGVLLQRTILDSGGLFSEPALVSENTKLDHDGWYTLTINSQILYYTYDSGWKFASTKIDNSLSIAQFDDAGKSNHKGVAQSLQEKEHLDGTIILFDAGNGEIPSFIDESLPVTVEDNSERKYYGLTAPLTVAGLKDRRYLTVGGDNYVSNTAGAYLRGSLIYVQGIDEEPVGAFVSPTGRLNIPHTTLEQFKTKYGDRISDATYCHLKFLHNKFLPDIEDGSVEYISDKVFDPGVGISTCNNVIYE